MIIESVMPWYITPEIITRPTVISLWGMTGTGKTSVVKRLTELLRISSKRVDIDCGESDSETASDIEQKICSIFGIGDAATDDGDLENIRSSVFILDEFQYARTIDESGVEIDKSNQRTFWSLLDDGIVSIRSWYSSGFSTFIEFLEIFKRFSVKYPDFNVSCNLISDKEDIKKILLFENFNKIYRKKYMGSRYDGSSSYDFPVIQDSTKSDEEPFRLVVQLSTITDIAAKSNKERAEEIFRIIQEDTLTAKDLAKLLEELKVLAMSPRTLNCSKALVFVIGNLDEVFASSGTIDPDVDADIFYDITKKVKISDIKSALKSRFRPEQIARLGNNIIKYPTLSKNSLYKVVDREIAKVLSNFQKLRKGKVKVSDEVRHMLFSEGVYPTQGVRPIFSTIETMLAPYLSKILIHFSKKSNIEIGIGDTKDWTVKRFRMPETTITITSDDTKKEYKHKLFLGNDRKLEGRIGLYNTAIHESGHAIVQAYVYGIPPVDIVATSSNSTVGGFTLTHNNDISERNSRYDIESSIMISLGGYTAEELLIDREEMRSMGASGDLTRVWGDLKSASLYCGYFSPVPLDIWQASSMYGAEGFDIDKKLRDSDEKTPEEMMKDLLFTLMDRTKSILEGEKRLLKEISKYLGNNGSIDSKVFMEFVEKYGNKLTLEYMKNKKKDLDGSYYKQCLED